MDGRIYVDEDYSSYSNNAQLQNLADIKNCMKVCTMCVRVHDANPMTLQQSMFFFCFIYYYTRDMRGQVSIRQVNNINART